MSVNSILSYSIYSANVTGSVLKTVSYNKIVSNELFVYFDTFVNFWCILCLSSIGIVTNAMCGIVFVKQGFKDGVNVSMLSVTFWNELKCLSGCLNRMYGPLSLFSADLATKWRLMTSFNQYTPIFSGYVAYCLMAYISVERLLCVTRPFTVKSFLTPQRALAAVLGVSLLAYGGFFVMYFIYELAFAGIATSNLTQLAVQYNRFYIENEAIIMPYYKSLAIVLPSFSFLILCASSGVTVVCLKNSSKFLTAKKEKPTRPISLREKKVTMTLLAVILVNICNLFPRVIFYVGQLVEPEFYVIRRYHNFFMTAAMFIYILDYVNTIAKFFIFLAMSVGFRKTFGKIFISRKSKKCVK